MRIYNGTNSHLNLPLTGSQRITVPPHAVSGDILPSTDFLSLMVSSYDFSEIAFIISGPFELNMCANVSGATGFVVNSLEEAVERFCPTEKEEKKERNEITEKNQEEPQKVVASEVESIKDEDGDEAEKDNTSIPCEVEEETASVEETTNNVEVEGVAAEPSRPVRTVRKTTNVSKKRQ